jgi:iron complex transport system ATP-binding protein
MLQIKNLSVQLKSRKILEATSFNIEPGCLMAVIGPNGAGKTTLLRAITGVIPSLGQVLVNGKDLSKMNPTQRARLVAVVPQANQLPPAFTGWETVLLGRTPYLNWLGQTSLNDEKIVHHAMESTQTLEFADRRMGELSGGEQQRILLARAQAQSTPVLLMDEPTNHLDLQYQYTLLEQIRTLAHQNQLAVLAVLHDLNLVARYADKVLLLVDGKTRAAGKPDDVLCSDLLSQAYRIPLQVFQDRHAQRAFIAPC